MENFLLSTIPERALPTLRLGTDEYYVNLQRGGLVLTTDTFHRIVLSAIQPWELEDFFLIAYHVPSRRALTYTEIETAHLHQVRLYLFGGIGQLDPAGYAALFGRPMPVEYLVSAPLVTIARQIRLSRSMRRQLIHPTLSAGVVMQLQKLLRHRNGVSIRMVGPEGASGHNNDLETRKRALWHS